LAEKASFGLETAGALRVITVIVALWIVRPPTAMSTMRSRPMPVSRNRPSASVVTLAGSPGRFAAAQRSLAKRWFEARSGSSRSSFR
jgi:hypothetical protein